MQIYNDQDIEPYDLEAPLSAMATDPDRLTAARGRMLLELVRYLLTRGPNPQVGALVFEGEIELIPLRQTNARSIRIWVDYRDYGPVRNGLPDLYYRLQVERSTTRISSDHRVAAPAEVEQVLLQAIGS